MALILAFQDRGTTRDIVILDVDGNAITPGDNDRIRAIIGREGDTPLLTVVDDAPTPAGSSFTKGATNRLRLDATDLAAIPAGTYTLFLDIFDVADAREWKSISRQIFVLEAT